MFNASYSTRLQSKNVTLSQVVEGCTPTLHEITEVYNRDCAEALIFAWLVGFDAYIGKGCFDQNQLNELSTTIVSKMYNLKIAEVAMFFVKLKEGEYGDIYGKINPLWVTSAFSKFFRERAGVIAENEREKERKEREYKQKKEAETAVSYQEYLKLKKEGKL